MFRFGIKNTITKIIYFAKHQKTYLRRIRIRSDPVFLGSVGSGFKNHIRGSGSGSGLDIILMFSKINNFCMVFLWIWIREKWTGSASLTFKEWFKRGIYITGRTEMFLLYALRKVNNRICKKGWIQQQSEAMTSRPGTPSPASHSCQVRTASLI